MAENREANAEENHRLDAATPIYRENVATATIFRTADLGNGETFKTWTNPIEKRTILKASRLKAIWEIRAVLNWVSATTAKNEKINGIAKNV